MTPRRTSRALPGWSRRVGQPRPDGLVEAVRLRGPLFGRYLLAVVGEDLVLVRQRRLGAPPRAQIGRALPLAAVRAVQVQRERRRSRWRLVVALAYVDPHPPGWPWTVRYLSWQPRRMPPGSQLRRAAWPVTSKLQRLTQTEPGPGAPPEPSPPRWSDPSPR